MGSRGTRRSRSSTSSTSSTTYVNRAQRVLPLSAHLLGPGVDWQCWHFTSLWHRQLGSEKPSYGALSWSILHAHATQRQAESLTNSCHRFHSLLAERQPPTSATTKAFPRGSSTIEQCVLHRPVQAPSPIDAEASTAVVSSG